MRTPSSLRAVVAASLIAALTSGYALADTTWTFTKSPAPRATRAVASAAGLDAMVFNVTAAGVGLTRVTRMAFMVMGTLQRADFDNLQLVYYQHGLAGPGVVVGSEAGAGLAPGERTLVSIDVTAPIAIQGDYAGVFALRADVKGTRSFFFVAQLQRVTIEQDGVERNLTETEDLPMQGDTFYVN